MRRQDFTFELPERLIAQRPAHRRDESRLMRVPMAGSPTISAFPSIVDMFVGDEVLVVNNTRVVPARVRGHKETGGAVEVFVLEPLGTHRVRAMLRGKNLRPGSRIVLPEGQATVLERRDGLSVLALEGIDDLWAWLDAVGHVPLPPYIRRDADADDVDRYQTVYAAERGAVAAPTAGLHFTAELLDALTAKGVKICSVTLHVGLGTFLPVRVEDLNEHVMHTERYVIPTETQRFVASGRPVVAVGTTVVRALENHALDPGATETDIFIRPGFEFRRVDGMLTNFHLPESTLLMLVSAFAGHERILRAYQEAVQAQMRFFSYGDAMLLCREGGRWRT